MRFVGVTLAGFLGVGIGAVVGFGIALLAAKPRYDGTFGMREILVGLPSGAVAGLVAGIILGLRFAR